MAFKTILDFNDFCDLGDYWGTSFNLPNGSRFSFWDCYLRYVHINDHHYLEVVANEKRNIDECLLILSFCTTIPLIALHYEIISIDHSEYMDNCNQQQDHKTVWDDKLIDIERILKNRRNRSDDKRRIYFDLIKKCILGARCGYREYYEDEFMMYFKPVEKISKLYIDKNVIISEEKKEQVKNSFQTFLENDILHNELNLEFDSDTLQELTGEVNNLFINNIIKNNNGRIVVAWKRQVDNISGENTDRGDRREYLLGRIDSTKIHELVKVRNKISHGEIVELSEEIKYNVEYLAYQMISIYIFEKEYESIHLGSKKLNRDFWC